MADRVRIFFSTRERDHTGKFLSHIAFVDFGRDLRAILGTSMHSVIRLGERGCFDEHGIFPIHVIRDEDKILAYTTGWNRKVSVSAETSIGLAVSHDGGDTFVKTGPGPIMTASLHEPFLVADPFIIRRAGLLHMWYIFGTHWKKLAEHLPPDRVYKIAHATSTDGINWHRDGKTIIADKLNADECQALPTVFEHGGRFHMYFCYRQAHGFREHATSAYRLGYAFSEDMINWTRDDDQAGIDVSTEGWDSQMQCYPHVFRFGGKHYLLYNGNEFGRFGFGLAVLDE
ncbi:MAG: hypothetical protein SF172_12860 [Burkholderiales bacterium]|nr:hypothetical protein [Burkholderiales bacterium]